MVQKRFFYDEETYSIPRKHPRQVEYNNQLLSFSEFVPRELGSPRFHTSGEFGLTENAIEHHEKLAIEIDGSRFPIGGGKDEEDNVPGRNLISFSNIGFNEEASHPLSPVYRPYRPDYIIPNHLRTVDHHDDTYSLLLRNPPRKAVPIGSDHQADIPEWRPLDYKLKAKFTGTLGSIQDSQLVSENDEDKLMGTCVILMPDLECVNETENVKIECRCVDEGSIRCVRQHIVEARDKLERILGNEKFKELGFGVMGEQVANQWTEEEEELFHKVVFSNPMSMGKNFWNCLSVVFPCRTKMDIVSYYFNVFMLRRRAEQNRCKSEDGVCDSDDDEWQGSGDYGDNEAEFTEEDDEDDSFVGSPPQQDDWRLNREVQGNSHAMSDSEVLLQGIHVKAESDTHWPCSYNGLSYGSNQDHDIETCNVKLWDVDYTVCPKIDVDLLSTCSMIEEVFGGGSLNYKAKDD